MAKLVVIATHGVTTVDGTVISCAAAFAKSVDSIKWTDVLFSVLYDNDGRVIDIQYNEQSIEQERKRCKDAQAAIMRLER